jgi:hypothetical protein
MAVNITLYPATALFSKPKICSTQPSAMSFIKRRKSSSGFEPYNSIHSFPLQKIKDLKKKQHFSNGYIRKDKRDEATSSNMQEEEQEGGL